jgi:hypothetical protein
MLHTHNYELEPSRVPRYRLELMSITLDMFESISKFQTFPRFETCLKTKCQSYCPHHTSTLNFPSLLPWISLSSSFIIHPLYVITCHIAFKKWLVCTLCLMHRCVCVFDYTYYKITITNYISKTSLYTTFHMYPSGNWPLKILMFTLLVTREIATYSWPWE